LYPFILSLHGLYESTLEIDHKTPGGEKSGFIKQVWGTQLAKTFPAIVIAPNWAVQGSSGSGFWKSTDLRKIILEAIVKFNIDPDRIVVTGLSAGSIATQDLIKSSKDLITAAMRGAYNDSVVTSDPCVMADLPVWVFGNASDPLFISLQWSVTQGQVESCSNYRHDFKLTVYSNLCGHGCWDSHWAKSEVQEWLVSQFR